MPKSVRAVGTCFTVEGCPQRNGWRAKRQLGNKEIIVSIKLRDGVPRGIFHAKLTECRSWCAGVCNMQSLPGICH